MKNVLKYSNEVFVLRYLTPLVIWACCPKIVFVGKSRVEAAVSMAITTFSMLVVMGKLWLDSTVVTISTIRETDMLRMAKADTISVRIC